MKRQMFFLVYYGSTYIKTHIKLFSTICVLDILPFERDNDLSCWIKTKERIEGYHLKLWLRKSNVQHGRLGQRGLLVFIRNAWVN